MNDSASIKARLSEIFREVFDNDELEISPEMTAADVEEWDSLSHITLVVACEREFGVKLTPREVGSLENVGELLAMLEQRATR